MYYTNHMKSYIVLIRGINVGGKNKVAMAALKKCLEDLGFVDVVTYIASGNVLVKSKLGAKQVKASIEGALPKHFKLDSELIKVLVLTPAQLKTIITKKPRGFGEKPATYHSDVIFLIDISSTKAMAAFSPKEGVDTIWKGTNVVYSQRLSAQRTKSRLNRVMMTPAYQSMTIRNWNTATKLLEIVEDNKRKSEGNKRK